MTTTIIPESLQELIDRINIALRKYRPNNILTYRVLSIDEVLSANDEYILQSYEDVFWASGDSSDGWYPWGTVLNYNTIVGLSDYLSEKEMQILLTGMLQGIKIMA